MKPEMLPLAKKEVKTTPTSRETRYTFPDGSMIIQSVDGGTTSCGTGYCNFTNMTVKETRWYCEGRFQADFTLVNGGDDYISRVYDAQVWSAGSISDVSLNLTKAWEDLNGPAEAVLRWVAYNGVTSTTYILKLKVGGNNYWDECNY
ncbi:hypothetical protein [Effusibacillus pohliae]|uniref:hypothetical protein n=1 Tax=Effusibacillus pohliae TaxID=232270 RepID=UPI00035F13EC|nr:hypothetical protein [Effusibacillus pohliae]